MVDKNVAGDVLEASLALADPHSSNWLHASRIHSCRRHHAYHESARCWELNRIRLIPTFLRDWLLQGT